MNKPHKPRKLAVIAYNNCTIIDRTYSKIITGIDSLIDLNAAYRGVSPIYFSDTPAIPVTADISTLLGSDIATAGSDLVYLFVFSPAQDDYFSNRAQVDVIGYIVKEVTSNFSQLPDHTISMTAGSGYGFSRIPQFNRSLIVSPKGGVNSVTEYFISNVHPVQNAPSQESTLQAGLNYQTYGNLTEGQEGIVMPIPIAMNSATQPGAAKFQALVFKQCNLPNVQITVSPVIAHSLLGKVIPKLLK